jgi:hypothetical protein
VKCRKSEDSPEEEIMVESYMWGDVLVYLLSSWESGEGNACYCSEEVKEFQVLHVTRST